MMFVSHALLSFLFLSIWWNRAFSASIFLHCVLLLCIFSLFYVFSHVLLLPFPAFFHCPFSFSHVFSVKLSTSVSPSSGASLSPLHYAFPFLQCRVWLYYCVPPHVFQLTHPLVAWRFLVSIPLRNFYHFLSCYFVFLPTLSSSSPSISLLYLLFYSCIDRHLVSNVLLFKEFIFYSTWWGFHERSFKPSDRFVKLVPY